MDGSDARDVKTHGPVALTAAGLARRQATLDLEATARMSQLFARKRAKMGRSAQTFFRGCSPLFHKLLGGRPEQLPTPEGHGHIVGDMHLKGWKPSGARQPPALRPQRRDRADVGGLAGRDGAGQEAHHRERPQHHA